MGFFSGLREDLSQAVNELIAEENPDQTDTEETNDNAVLEEVLKNLDSILQHDMTVDNVPEQENIEKKEGA